MPTKNEATPCVLSTNLQLTYTKLLLKLVKKPNQLVVPRFRFRSQGTLTCAKGINRLVMFVFEYIGVKELLPVPRE